MASLSRTQQPVNIERAFRLKIRRSLLNWYDHHKRDLPWRRRAGDPYAQWVAEIMLQQTRVETVIAYYDRFMARFPTIQSLANAKREVVLKHWEGLGYYRRILHFHQAARDLNNEGRAVPTTSEELRNLRGVGPYTAAAIASIAFNEPAAAVDGNVMRVLARLFGVNEDVLSTRGRKIIQSLADQLVPPDRPGDFNQAWMDLGSMVCRPQLPQCEECPLSSVCQARASDRASDFPVRNGRHRESTPVVRMVAVIFRCGERMLVRRRPEGGLWSGLWEFPNLERPKNGKHSETIATLARLHRLPSDTSASRIALVKHQLTHRTLHFDVFLADVAQSISALPRSSETKWVDVRGFEKLPVSTAHRKIFRSVINTR